MITGHEIAALRRMLGFSRPEMSILLNASESSIRRWEAAGDQPATMENRSNPLLFLLREEMHRDAERVCAALREHRRDGLRSLYALLSLRYGPLSADPSPLGRAGPAW